MIQFQFQPSILKACLAFVSTDETRYVLNGVHVILTPGRRVRFEATDGRRLVVHDTEFSHYEKEPTDFIIPSDLIAALTIPDIQATEQTISFDGSIVTMRGDRLTFSGPFVDGKYVNTKAVIPDPLPEGMHAGEFAFNGQFIAEILTSIRALESRDHPPFRLLGSGPEAPIVFLGRSTTALLMPVRNADTLKGAK